MNTVVARNPSNVLRSIRAACTLAGALSLALLANVTPLHAQHAQHAPHTDTGHAEADHPVVERSAEAGMFLPLTIAPRVDSQRAFMLMLGGYDSAREAGQFDAVADVTVIGPLALRVGTTYTGTPDRFRPNVGVRVQPLSQADHEIDGAIGLFYKPEGFTEAEGEIEAVLSVGRRFGNLGTFANLVYGQDPEGRERDGEFRLAALYSFSAQLNAGLDLRARFDLGEDGEEGEGEDGVRRIEAEYDFIAGPTASYVLGPVAVVAQVGVSAVGFEPSGRAGVIALAGLSGSL